MDKERPCLGPLSGVAPHPLLAGVLDESPGLVQGHLHLPLLHLHVLDGILDVLHGLGLTIAHGDTFESRLAFLYGLEFRH